MRYYKKKDKDEQNRYMRESVDLNRNTFIFHCKYNRKIPLHVIQKKMGIFHTAEKHNILCCGVFQLKHRVFSDNCYFDESHDRILGIDVRNEIVIIFRYISNTSRIHHYYNLVLNYIRENEKKLGLSNTSGRIIFRYTMG